MTHTNTHKKEHKGVSPVAAAVAGAVVGAGVAVAGAVALRDEKNQKKVKDMLHKVKDHAEHSLKDAQKAAEEKRGELEHHVKKTTEKAAKELDKQK